ncbi:PDZ domain-containing protein [Puniceicoccales bacterium CK1056]|uniref:PDZ domain-containing protein n=1 Tax=Oceanipulchritudo coccoides TaxID=2706888 RepID=A0A6B2LYN8_9BACT|nr:PDZ domain-containing protein [Oceanipulchritudo coccoides]NDV61149.1 PDZ domain-containing protein [Oceanipulchritudo coccoides]
MKSNTKRSFPALAGILVMLSCSPLLASEDSQATDGESIQAIVTEAQRMAQEWAQRIRGWSEGSEKNTTYLGVVIESVPKVLRDYIDLPDGVGLLFTRIAKDSPAEKAGLMDNDIIVSFDGQLIINFNQLSTLIDLRGPGAEVPMKILRKGEEIDLTVTLEERVRRNGSIVVPDAPDIPELPESPDADGVGLFMEKIEEWIPGSVKVFVDENEQVHVDLQDLKEDLHDLRLKVIELRESNGAPSDIRKEYGDLGARTKVVRVQDRRVNYTSPEGFLVLSSSESGQQAEVRDAQGSLVYEGPVPEDYARTLPEKAVELIDAYMGSREKLQLESDGKTVEIEINDTEIEPLTLVLDSGEAPMAGKLF